MKIFTNLVFLILFLTQQISAQLIKNVLTINGSIENFRDSTNYIYAIFLGGNPFSDSSKVINGKYNFINHINTTTRVTLYSKSENDPRYLKEKNIISFISEPTMVSIISKDSFVNASINGSNAYIEYNNYEQSILKILNELNGVYKMPTNEKNKIKLNRSIDSLNRKLASQQLLFIKNKNNLYTRPFVLEHFLKTTLNITKIDDINAALDIYQSFTINEKTSFIGKKIKKTLDAFEVKVGDKIINFRQSDANGNNIDFKEFSKGKYVLIDFWASWCGPCRKESPYLVSLNQKFQNKNFNLIGVSLDQNKKLWLDAIAKDTLKWTHVSDLKFWNNEAAKLYKIASVPTKFLINPNGIIIAKIVGIDDNKLIEKKLDELLQSQ